ncbi:FAD-dependent oxidoreductase [Candidatus Woesearchaeota archaeon]|nr:FAD-dependent oxidoreductase [Candidatus Woesearchaeota archaeon]
MVVVIVGGGFCGSYCARKLEKKFDVILIDSKDYFEFTPGIPHVVCDIEHRDKIRVRHEDYLRKAKIIIGTVETVTKDYVRVNNKIINYDYLILSSGSIYRSPFKSNIITAVSRSEDLVNFHNEIEKAEHILVIGGGLVGVEMAAELLTYTNKEVTLIEQGSRLLKRNPEKVGDYAKEFLLKKECEIIFDDKVVKFGKNNFLTEKGKQLVADFAFICTGIIPNSKFDFKGFDVKFDAKGYLIVDEYLRISDSIFVGGDVVSLNEERTAQNARRHAETICKNIINGINGKSLVKYVSKKTPLVISLGSYNGIFVSKNFVFPGIIPGILKRLIEKQVMFDYRKNGKGCCRNNSLQ